MRRLVWEIFVGPSVGIVTFVAFADDDALDETARGVLGVELRAIGDGVVVLGPHLAGYRAPDCGFPHIAVYRGAIVAARSRRRRRAVEVFVRDCAVDSFVVVRPSRATAPQGGLLPRHSRKSPRAGVHTFVRKKRNSNIR